MNFDMLASVKACLAASNAIILKVDFSQVWVFWGGIFFFLKKKKKKTHKILTLRVLQILVPMMYDSVIVTMECWKARAAVWHIDSANSERFKCKWQYSIDRTKTMGHSLTFPWLRSE